MDILEYQFMTTLVDVVSGILKAKDLLPHLNKKRHLIGTIYFERRYLFQKTKNWTTYCGVSGKEIH